MSSNNLCPCLISLLNCSHLRIGGYLRPFFHNCWIKESIQVPNDGLGLSADTLPERHGIFRTPSALKQPSGPDLVLFSVQIFVKILSVIVLISEMKRGKWLFVNELQVPLCKTSVPVVTADLSMRILVLNDYKTTFLKQDKAVPVGSCFLRTCVGH